MPTPAQRRRPQSKSSSRLLILGHELVDATGKRGGGGGSKSNPDKNQTPAPSPHEGRNEQRGVKEAFVAGKRGKGGVLQRKKEEKKKRWVVRHNRHKHRQTDGQGWIARLCAI